MSNDSLGLSVLFTVEFGSTSEDGNDRVSSPLEYGFGETEFSAINFVFHDNDAIE